MNILDILQFVNFQSLILLTAVVIIYRALQFKEKSPTPLPPGPRGWPILGNLPSLNFNWERVMYRWNKQYGPICRLKFATMEFVILGSAEAVEEAFVKKKEVFSDRMQNSISSLNGDSGIVFINNGIRLKEQRRFGLSTLKYFGMGRRSLEPEILKLCSDLCQELEQYSESRKPIDISYAIYERVSAAICQLVFNKNLAKENKSFQELLSLVTTGTKYSTLTGIVVFYPALKAIPPFSWGEEMSNKFSNKMFSMIQEQIEEHRTTRDPKEPRDFIDCFLQEMEERKVNSEVNVDQEGFNDEQLNSTVRDLFLAGFETSSTTLCWTVLFLTKYPECQAKLHQEIDKVLQHQTPSISLADQLNYVKAVTQETLRLRPIVPIGIPHVASRDATIMGYRIKKGTCVAANLYGIQNDETIWPNPEVFDPTRHLNEEGKFIKHANIMPFSIGARQCLGMQLANMELFLFTVSLFQKFSFELSPGQDIDMKGKNVFTLRPHPYKVIVKIRE